MASFLRRRCVLNFHRHFSSHAAAPLPPPPPPSESISASLIRTKIKSEQDPDAIVRLVSPLAESLTATTSVAGRHARDIAVRRLAKYRRSSDVEAFLEGMKKHHPQTANPEAFLSGLIISYGKAGMVDHAVRSFDELEGLGVRPSLAAFNALLAACVQAKRFDKVPDLFHDIPSRYPEISPDKVSYGVLAKALCEKGKPEKAYDLLKEMEEKEIEVTGVTYTTILDGFYKKRNEKMGDKIWDLMRKKEGSLIDSTAYNAKILNVAHNGKPEEVLKLLEEMERLGLKPNVVSYNFLLTSYCKSGNYEEGKKVYRQMRGKGCHPNAATFRTLLFFLCKGGDLESAMKVYKESVRRDRIPDFGTMKIFVEALTKGSREADAKSVIAQMKKKYQDSFLNAWRKLEVALGFTEDDGGSSAVASA
ncbi:pentatricopeptide repeat-containing protein At4g36680, mitochondrial-like [Nymphaea colorata]|uniref:Pentacotripeptide-repeat region of PRORP domain-containing protein n=1 Tax=Nymphaea colorata TaxID=210225 RepID=A0A5K1AD19_9MAGN|nr:pentatricopeptide repeat-containing protein At4g36680, mitochondrial-like [Nymphaea colorata]